MQQANPGWGANNFHVQLRINRGLLQCKLEFLLPSRISVLLYTLYEENMKLLILGL
jgi:hypothetical protein